MGQAQSLTGAVPETVDSVVHHAKVLAEINSLTYEEFKNCLDKLNELSRKCIDPNGKQLVFVVKRGSDAPCLLWKATVKIACIKVNPNTRQIDSYKFLNLKQFLCVFKTFQAHLESLVSSENQRSSRRGSQSPSDDSASLCGVNEGGGCGVCRVGDGCDGGAGGAGGAGGGSCGIRCGSRGTNNYNITASVLLNRVNALVDNNVTHECSNSDSSPTSSTICTPAKHFDECSICLDRRTEVLLPCTHSFCTPCIEQWNVNKKYCPICSEILESTDDTWIISEIPGVEEINEKICTELMNLAKEDS